MTFQTLGSAIAPTVIASALIFAAPALGGGNPACPGEGDCFAANGSPGCDNETCCNIVCDNDDFCCDTEWDGSCAAAAADLCSAIPCDDGSADPEGDDCGEDTNGGCNADPVAFGSISDGQKIAGLTFADGGTRDLDWYELEVSDPNGDGKAVITGTIASRFFGQLTILDASDCGNLVVIGGVNGTNDCQASSIERCVDAPGTYVILVGIVDETGAPLFDGVPCGSGMNDYVIEVSINDDAGDCVLATCNPGDTTLSQSNSQDIIAFNGIACSPNAGVTTTENQFARSYDLGALIPGKSLSLGCVELGVETYTGNEELIATLNIYEDTNGGDPIAPGNDLQLLGTTSVILPVGLLADFAVGSFDPPLVLPPDIVIVAEFDIPDLSGIASVFPGTNSAGESNNTFLRSASCGLTEFMTYADIGFPNVHWVQNVIGDVGGVDCPADLDGSGTVGPGDLAILLGSWNDAGGPSDLDGSGTVGAGDLAILLGNWGPC